jgi:hypothetical protein
MFPLRLGEPLEVTLPILQNYSRIALVVLQIPFTLCLHILRGVSFKVAYYCNEVQNDQ